MAQLIVGWFLIGLLLGAAFGFVAGIYVGAIWCSERALVAAVAAGASAVDFMEQYSFQVRRLREWRELKRHATEKLREEMKRLV